MRGEEDGDRHCKKLSRWWRSISGRGRGKANVARQGSGGRKEVAVYGGGVVWWGVVGEGRLWRKGLQISVLLTREISPNTNRVVIILLYIII